MASVAPSARDPRLLTSVCQMCGGTICLCLGVRHAINLRGASRDIIQIIFHAGNLLAWYKLFFYV